ncbi:uncharacterized protein [Diabrotica undecimpunctata]|uniref:uncharacterized protein isoform X2 n=1 Tax=Diabrotica undecimpunctata TaxID=50387 RepID=UPI003B63E1EA
MIAKSLVSYDLTSDEYDSDADPEYTVSEGNSKDSEVNEIVPESPVKPRWRKADTHNWKANQIKTLRSECKPYVTKTGLKAAKAPKSIDCSKCRFKCTINFSNNNRTEIFHAYWNFKDYNRQKDYLIQNVRTQLPKRRRVGAKKRVMAKQYYLRNSNGVFRVCANFFEKTLCISNGPINTALAKNNEFGTFSGSDNRGHKTPGNATSKENTQCVREHIESFLTMLPHYVRKTSRRQYLDPKLSILKMYSLYLDFCKEKNVLPVKSNVYRNIFCTQYNLFTPKKNQCSLCTKYNAAKEDEHLKQLYEDHVNRKEECYQAKHDDKAKASNEANFQTITFDLQSVLQLPSSDVGQLYYSRKLCLYNLTICEGGKENRGFCFCWNEINGKRGSNEIATILTKYIDRIPSNITHLSIFSDTCGGQNRNQNVAAAMLYCVQNHATVEIIEHTFLESGHSYMECDSMQSAIEKEKKNRSVFVMNDWKEIFKNARTKNKSKKTPYEVYRFF